MNEPLQFIFSNLIIFLKNQNTTAITVQCLYFTGWSSLLVTSIIWIHLFFDFVIPTNSQTYYLTKDFVTNLVIFVIVPLMFIFGNENLTKYVLQHISLNQFYTICNSTYQSCSAVLPNKRCRGNHVTPLPQKDNSVYIDDNQRIIYI